MRFLLFIGFLVAVAWFLFHASYSVSQVSETASDMVGCLWAGIVVFIIAALLLTYGHC